MEENKTIDLDSLQPVKSGDGVDLKKFHNTTTVVEKIEMVQTKSNFTAKDANGNPIPQWCLKISSPVLTTVGEGEQKFDIRASELFNLSQDKNGKLLGYPTNKDSNLVKFMKDIGANHPKEIIGKTVFIKAHEKDSGEGQIRTFLKFKY